MNEPLDDLYLTWLYENIGSLKEKAPSRTHWNLARQLFSKEFVWIVPNDDNRVEDGKELRLEFLHYTGATPGDPMWMDLGCSMLEMLVALSRRLAFETGRDPVKWFWRLMDNLDLEQHTDRRYNEMVHRHVDEVMDRVIWRTYHHDGRGGLFPLESPPADQREVEIWYQLSAYLLEQE